MSARKGLFGSPFGAGILSITASSTSSIPIPAFAEVKTISDSLQPIKSMICCLTDSNVVAALGKSILLITGIISNPASIAR